MYFFYFIQAIYLFCLFLTFYKDSVNFVNNCNYIERLFSIKKNNIIIHNDNDIIVNTESYDLINDENDIIDIDLDENISLFKMIYNDVVKYVLHDYLND